MRMGAKNSHRSRTQEKSLDHERSILVTLGILPKGIGRNSNFFYSTFQHFMHWKGRGGAGPLPYFKELIVIYAGLLISRNFLPGGSMGRGVSVHSANGMSSRRFFEAWQVFIGSAHYGQRSLCKFNQNY